MKSCTRCGHTGPLEDFHRKARATDGRQSWCKDCARVASAECKGRQRPRSAIGDGEVTDELRQLIAALHAWTPGTTHPTATTPKGWS